ncbi:MAG: DNA repair protein RadA [Rhodospirillaceae bacterium]|nr:DNA repair protein RadA [Rhodospirillaceae bacterium]|tara:strand:+ start:570 stop:1976 length:1407 start_codon:yes stop_codon:yes gene_type:complete
MARVTTQFVCQSCATVHRKWSGKCDTCGEWNTIVEESDDTNVPRGVSKAGGKPVAFTSLDGAPEESPRRLTGLAEFDQVCGGGLVPGSALLVGGDPGIGKSTLLLQAAALLARAGVTVAYISGEEAIDQIRLRAARLGLADTPVDLASATNIRDILAALDAPNSAEIAIIDSIQTMYAENLDSAPGTVAQVRTCAQELIRVAKRRGVTMILVGHVTKEGAIAGPRVLEHMVDAVLYFEGERENQFRLLRAVKNRFGATNEIGVFEMTDTGLTEVENPSELFIAGHRDATSGSAVFAGIEGTRPLLVEIQALVAPTPLGTPRRAVVGWDSSRLAMIIAVLQTRCGMNLGAHDVYLNVAGGLRVGEPAADLAVAAALVSAHLEQPLPPRTVVFGEIGLGGEVRSVGQADARLREAEKLGFERALTPPLGTGGKSGSSRAPTRLDVSEIARLRDLFNRFNVAPQRGNLATA